MVLVTHLAGKDIVCVCISDCANWAHLVSATPNWNQNGFSKSPDIVYLKVPLPTLQGAGNHSMPHRPLPVLSRSMAPNAHSGHLRRVLSHPRLYADLFITGPAYSDGPKHQYATHRLSTKPKVHVWGIGVVPVPPPLPRYHRHNPQLYELLNCAAFSAT